MKMDRRETTSSSDLI